MLDIDALHRCVCESPDDDTPRLIYADALEEGGEEERGEFIRVQVELARCSKCEWGKPHGCKSDADAVCIPCAKRIKLHRREGKLWDLDTGERFNKKWLLYPDAPKGFDITVSRERYEHNQTAAMALVSRGFIGSLRGAWSDVSAVLDKLLWQPPKKCKNCDGTGYHRYPDCYPGTPNYSDTAPCSACRGVGEVPGATVPCPNPVCEKGRTWFCDDAGKRHVLTCPQCSGSGRVAVPFSRGMQPLEEITLTTWPTFRDADGIERPATSEPAVRAALGHKWPSIKVWNLPAQWTGVHLARGPDWTAQYQGEFAPTPGDPRHIIRGANI